MFEPPEFDPNSKSRLTAITLGEGSIRRGNLDIEREREVAIFDILESNRFELEGRDDGPYALNLSIIEDRLVFAVAQENGGETFTVVLSLTPLRRVMKDYFIVCESYYQAIRTSPPSRIQSIDMGRRALHNEGSKVLLERLKGKITVDGFFEGLDDCVNNEYATRLAILRCAAEVFSERPYHEVLTDHISARLKIGKGTLYRYFASKEELYFASIVEGLQGMQEVIAAEAVMGQSLFAGTGSEPEVLPDAQEELRGELALLAERLDGLDRTLRKLAASESAAREALQQQQAQLLGTLSSDRQRRERIMFWLIGGAALAALAALASSLLG